MAYQYAAKDLAIQQGSGLSFPWAELQDQPVIGSSTHTFGADGVVLGMKMLVNWTDISTALVELLGFSWRDDSQKTARGTPFLRRELPWQHPLFNQLYVKRISEVKGWRHQGKVTVATLEAGGDDEIEPTGSGQGELPNTGPTADYELAELTIHFWRPPYYVRSDQAILDPMDNTNPREWLRYVSKGWEMSLNMLSRENSSFVWLPGSKLNTTNPFTGSVGQSVAHFRVSRTWYQIPEQALFASTASGIPDGQPEIVLTINSCENPLSLWQAALPTTQITVGTTVTTTYLTTTPNTSQLLGALGYVYGTSKPIAGCVNSPIGGGRAVDGMGNWADATTASRLWGCRTGTLRFDGVTFTPQPLQLPPSLMKIPMLGNVEALSQQQYDVTFHFDLFEPPPGNGYGTPICGHNLFPYAGNAQWYPLLTQRDINDQTVGPFLTPFNYCDLTDLFYIL